VKFIINLIFILVFFSKTGFSQDSLCNHSTEGNTHAKGMKISLSFPCDWIKVQTNSSSQIFKFLKKDEDSQLVTSVSIDISDLPDGLSLSEAKNFLKPEILSDGTGEIISRRPLTVDKIIGNQIIRKDAKNNFYRSFNYFFYKNKLVSITYYVIFGAEVNVKDCFNRFDTFLSKSKFN
jgi:hypothetical protein